MHIEKKGVSHFGLVFSVCSVQWGTCPVFEWSTFNLVEQFDEVAFTFNGTIAYMLILHAHTMHVPRSSARLLTSFQQPPYSALFETKMYQEAHMM